MATAFEYTRFDSAGPVGDDDLADALSGTWTWTSGGDGRTESEGGTYNGSTEDDYNYTYTGMITHNADGSQSTLGLSSNDVSGSRSGNSTEWSQWYEWWSGSSGSGSGGGGSSSSSRSWSASGFDGYSESVNYPGFYEGAYYGGGSGGGGGGGGPIDYVGDLFSGGSGGGGLIMALDGESSDAMELEALAAQRESDGEAVLHELAVHKALASFGKRSNAALSPMHGMTQESLGTAPVRSPRTEDRAKPSIANHQNDDESMHSVMMATAGEDGGDQDSGGLATPSTPPFPGQSLPEHQGPIGQFQTAPRKTLPPEPPRHVEPKIGKYVYGVFPDPGFGKVVGGISSGIRYLLTRGGAKAAAGVAGKAALTQAEKSVAQLAGRLKFTETAGRHMAEAGRYVPRHTLAEAIQTGARMPDPQGAAGAVKIVKEVWVNGQKRILEIVYRESDNTILHFLYK